MAQEASHDDATSSQSAGMTTPSFQKGLMNAYNAIHDLGGAEYGDKTMVDALYPAAQEVAKLDPGVPVTDAFVVAADAAVKSVRDTQVLAARKGRASYLGEQTKDVPDPGAIVVTWLFGYPGTVAEFS